MALLVWRVTISSVATLFLSFMKSSFKEQTK